MSHDDPVTRPWRRYLRRIIYLAIAVALAILVHGWIIRPAGQRSVVSLARNTGDFDPTPRRTFRIAAFNIQNGRGTDGRTDITRSAGLLGSFDVVCLNELRGKLWGHPANHAEALGGHLRSPWLFAPAERRFWHDSFGNGLLSRIHVTHASIWPLANSQWSGYRNIVHARLALDGGQWVNLLITHIDRRDDRAGQFHAVRELFLSLSEPAVLVGDLNTRRDEPMMRDLLSAAGVADAIGDTDASSSTERIDWILTRGLQTLESGAVNTPASDHPLLWAHLALPDQTIERPATTPSTNASTRPNP